MGVIRIGFLLLALNSYAAIPAFSLNNPFFAVNRSLSASCATSKDTHGGTATGNDGMFLFGGGNKYIGTHFVAGTTYTVCSAVVRGGKAGTGGSMNISAEIWSDSSGLPGTIVGTASATILGSSFPSSEADVTFTGMSASITSGTTYWLVCHADATSDNTNYPLWYYVGFDATGDEVSANGTSWSTVNNRLLKFTLYGP